MASTRNDQTDGTLLDDVRDDFLAHADASRAVQMRAYAKSDVPFYGIDAPTRRTLLKPHLKTWRAHNPETYVERVLELWSGTHREEHYAAIDYARAHKTLITLAQIDLYEQLVREGAWWDHVDVIANHLVGAAVRKQPEEGFALMDEWIEDADFWIRRTAILCQLAFKQNTDEERLFEYCRMCMHEKEFFIRKAIGWALRQYSYIEPEAVRTFVSTHHDELSGLSRREALKRLKKL